MTGRGNLMAYSVLADRAAWAGYVEEFILSNKIQTSEKLQILTNSLTNCLLLENAFMYFLFKRSTSLWRETIWHSAFEIQHCWHCHLLWPGQWEPVSLFSALRPLSSSQVIKVLNGHGVEAERCFALPVSCCQKFVPLCPKRLARNSHYCWRGPPSSSSSWHVCWKCASCSVGGLTGWPSSPYESRKMPRALFCPLLTMSQTTATAAWYG